MLLARFAAGAGRTGRVVLHPHLTVLPVDARAVVDAGDDFETEVPVRTVTATDIARAVGVGADVARLDEDISALEAAVARLDAARRAVAQAEASEAESREALSNLAAQRNRAQETTTAALERIAVLERAPDVPDAEVAALRAQVDAVHQTIEEAARTRTAAAETAHAALAGARRAFSAVEHELQRVLDRVEPGVRVADAAGVVASLRARRAALASLDPADPATVIELVAAEHPDAVLVLVDAFEAPPAELVDALARAAGTAQIVYVTVREEVIQAARALDPHGGAVREPLITGGRPEPLAVAPSVGSPS